MHIKWQSYPTAFWHKDCPEDDRGGIMKHAERREDGDLMECLQCGAAGVYPVGGSGCVEVAAERERGES